jgi:hypothetical protein
MDKGQRAHSRGYNTISAAPEAEMSTEAGQGVRWHSPNSAMRQGPHDQGRTSRVCSHRATGQARARCTGKREPWGPWGSQSPFPPQLFMEPRPQAAHNLVFCFALFWKRDLLERAVEVDAGLPAPPPTVLSGKGLMTAISAELWSSKGQGPPMAESSKSKHSTQGDMWMPWERQGRVSEKHGNFKN